MSDGSAPKMTEDNDFLRLNPVYVKACDDVMAAIVRGVTEFAERWEAAKAEARARRVAQSGLVEENTDD